MDPDQEAPADDDGPSLRDTLESSIEKHAPEGGDSQVAPTQPAESAPDDAAQPVEKAAKGDRDSLGRFLPKGEKPQEGQEAPIPAPGTPGAIQPAAGQPAPVQAAPQAIPAPASWSPLAREQWKGVPPAAQAEIARREADMARYVGEASAARNIAERFTQTIQPFLGVIQAEGVDPLTAVRNLMSVTQTMRQGTQYEKAQMLAQAIKVYGVDVNMRDEALVGTLQPGQGGQQAAVPQYVQQLVQQQLAPLYQAAQQRQYQIAQAADGEARSELQEFA